MNKNTKSPCHQTGRKYTWHLEIKQLTSCTYVSVSAKYTRKPYGTAKSSSDYFLYYELCTWFKKTGLHHPRELMQLLWFHYTANVLTHFRMVKIKVIVKIRNLCECQAVGRLMLCWWEWKVIEILTKKIRLSLTELASFVYTLTASV